MSETLDVLEPATEQVLATIPRAGIEQTDEAVARAKEALPAWRALAPDARAGILRDVTAILEEHHEELALLEARNAGKPIGAARGEIGGAIATFRYFAAAPERLMGDTIPVAGGVAMTFREPIGVVGLITPWNFPLAIASWKLAPALAAGNTVVLKPSELTPYTALRLAELASDVLPPGVLNVVCGQGETAGVALVDHAEVAMVSLTGSVAAGKAIARASAETLKRVHLELGNIPLDQLELGAVHDHRHLVVRHSFVRHGAGAPMEIIPAPEHPQEALTTERRAWCRLPRHVAGDPAATHPNSRPGDPRSLRRGARSGARRPAPARAGRPRFAGRDAARPDPQAQPARSR